MGLALLTSHWVGWCHLMQASLFSWNWGDLTLLHGTFIFVLGLSHSIRLIAIVESEGQAAISKPTVRLRSHRVKANSPLSKAGNIIEPSGRAGSLGHSRRT